MNKKIILIMVLIIIATAVIASGVYFYLTQRENNTQTDDILFGNEAREFCGQEPPINCPADTNIGCTAKDKKWGCYSFVETEKAKCEAGGGAWKTFNNGCVDSCVKARNPETIFCIQAFTDGCDCGPGKCWNGTSCENN